VDTQFFTRPREVEILIGQEYAAVHLVLPGEPLAAQIKDHGSLPGQVWIAYSLTQNGVEDCNREGSVRPMNGLHYSTRAVDDAVLRPGGSSKMNPAPLPTTPVIAPFDSQYLSAYQSSVRLSI
jgi:hypothetical protein